MRATVIDIETTGLGWKDRILTVATTTWDDADDSIQRASFNLGMSYLFHQPVSPGAARDHIMGAVGSSDWVVAHSATFDIPYLVRDQLLTLDALTGKVFDTLVMARCTAGHNSVSLVNLCAEYEIPADAYMLKLKRKRPNLAALDVGTVLEYNQKDTDSTLALFRILMPMAIGYYDDGWIRAEGEFARIVSKMRVLGAGIDRERIRHLLATNAKRMTEINWKLVRLADMDGPNDHTKLERFLRATGYGESIPSTEKGNASLDADTLRDIQFAMSVTSKERHVIDLVLEGRTTDKETETWLRGFLEEADDEGRVHSLLSVGGTQSFRLSSTHPNAQAVKGGLDLWCPADGYDHVEADFSQAELRLGAAFSRENSMAALFRDGKDLHLETAKLMYGEEKSKALRPQAKTANFCAFYGGGARALSESLGISQEKAQAIVDLHRKTFPSVRSSSLKAERLWKERGYLKLAHGKLLFPSEYDLRSAYKAFNQLVQASVSEIVKKAMLRLDAELPQVRQVLQVHDSLHLEVPSDQTDSLIPIIKQIMEGSAPEETMALTDPPICMPVDIKIKRGGKKQ